MSTMFTITISRHVGRRSYCYPFDIPVGINMMTIILMTTTAMIMITIVIVLVDVII